MMADLWNTLASVRWLPLALAPFVGSFLGVLILRLPAGERVGLSRSRCRHCGATLAVRDLVPLLSWTVGRGRCRHCRAPIGPFYPAIELAAVGIAGWAALIVPPAWLWPTAGLGWTLLALALIDVRHLMLPDALSLPLLVAGLSVTAVAASADFPAHLAGAVLGFCIPWAVRRLHFQIRKREGLGMGDVKLLAAAGAWVGWQGLPGVLLIAATAALVVTLLLALFRRALDRGEPIPFGPYLCLSLWLVWLYGPIVIG